MKSIFRPDSGLMIAMTQVTDCIFLSLFFILGCLPVVTVGASVAALYDASFRAFRKSEKNSWQRFWHVYRTNWKSSILPTLAFYALVALAGKWVISVWNNAVYGNVSWGVFAAVALVGLVILGVLSLLFPMLSRFENSFGALLKNTVVLALAHIPGTVMLGVVNAVVVGLCAKFVLPLFFLPALAALVGSLAIEPMFRPYMPPEETFDENCETSTEEAAQ